MVNFEFLLRKKPLQAEKSGLKRGNQGAKMNFLIEFRPSDKFISIDDGPCGRLLGTALVKTGQ